VVESAPHDTQRSHGKTLVENPPLRVEVQNEDSFFSGRSMPANSRRAIANPGKDVRDWLVKKHGSLEAAFAAWKGQKFNRDAPAEGRVAFRPLWNIFNEKTPRDQERSPSFLRCRTSFTRTRSLSCVNSVTRV